MKLLGLTLLGCLICSALLTGNLAGVVAVLTGFIIGVIAHDLRSMEVEH